MYIHIPIPIGVNRVASTRGSVLKCISCQRCRMQYAYEMDLEAEGEDFDLLFVDPYGSVDRARQKAWENLQRKGGNIVLPVPCPNCGTYQDDMVRGLKDSASINWLQIIGAVLLIGPFLPMIFGFRLAWLVAILGAAVGLALLVRGYALAFGYDPNAGDPEPRRALGRRVALWGEKFEELLKPAPGKDGEASAGVRE